MGFVVTGPTVATRCFIFDPLGLTWIRDYFIEMECSQSPEESSMNNVDCCWSPGAFLLVDFIDLQGTSFFPLL